MAHEATHENLSPEELKFKELVQRGDDYHKIELYRWALHYYKLAMETPYVNDELRGKAALVTGKIKKETRSIIGVLIVAAVVIALICLLT